MYIKRKERKREGGMEREESELPAGPVGLQMRDV